MGSKNKLKTRADTNNKITTLLEATTLADTASPLETLLTSRETNDIALSKALRT